MPGDLVESLEHGPAFLLCGAAVLAVRMLAARHDMPVPHGGDRACAIGGAGPGRGWPAALVGWRGRGGPRTSGPGFGVAMHDDVLAEPLKWRKPRVVFADSMTDIAHAKVSRA